MKISVALTPRLLREPQQHAVAVIDVLRATTSLVAMFERGLLRAIVSDNIQQARRLSRENFSLLCGEVKSVQPAGFDFGNSPVDFAAGKFRGKSAVIFTTNGTRAFKSVSEAPVVVAAALTNRRAAARRIIDEASRRGIDIAVLCAGTERGTAFSLEDTTTAGALVEAVHEFDETIVLSDDAWAALHLWRWYRGDAIRAFRQSAHGRSLLALGFERDLQFASRVDVSETVPVMYEEGEILVLRSRLPRRRR